jgi:hypothetical protein
MTQYHIHGERSDLKDAALDLFVGRCIGTGYSRHVYELLGQPDRVMKLEHGNRHFSNIVEWKVWQAVQATPHAKWFAPCYSISFTGTALVQARTIPLTNEEFEHMTEVPEFLSDIHRANFGHFEGRIVCHDYGRNNLMMLGMNAATMVSASLYSPDNGG